MSATARTLLLSTAVLLAGACSAPEAGKPDAKAVTKTTDTKVTTDVKAPPPAEAKKVTPPTPPAQPAQPPTPPPPKFQKGQLARPGLSPAELLEYNKAQGDPMGSIDLKTALAGDPALEDETKGKLFVTFDTTMGKFRCELFADKTPNTVANFVGLARGIRPWLDKKTGEWKTSNFFEGILFHRVIDGFMIQTGDPMGTGTGGPGYLIADEFDPTLKHVSGGILSMANRGPNTGSSQFFVTVRDTPHLDNKHAVFGKCDPKVAIAISKVKTRGDRPLDDIKINKLIFERAKK
jgi:peptidyl-prolyl cis-trans isomerase A (cyclophilin A)